MLKSQKWGRCMNSKLKTPAVEQLFEAVLSLENKDECFDFFEDVCTINELLSLAQRFKEDYRWDERRRITLKDGRYSSCDGEF